MEKPERSHVGGILDFDPDELLMENLCPTQETCTSGPDDVHFFANDNQQAAAYLSNPRNFLTALERQLRTRQQVHEEIIRTMLAAHERSVSAAVGTAVEVRLQELVVLVKSLAAAQNGRTVAASREATPGQPPAIAAVPVPGDAPRPPITDDCLPPGCAMDPEAIALNSQDPAKLNNCGISFSADRTSMISAGGLFVARHSGQDLDRASFVSEMPPGLARHAAYGVETSSIKPFSASQGPQPPSGPSSCKPPSAPLGAAALDAAASTSLNRTRNALGSRRHSGQVAVLGFEGERDEELWCFRRAARRLVNHTFFDYSVSALIVASAVTTGFRVDMAMKHLDDGWETPLAFRVIDVFMLCFFSCEISLRIINEMRHFVSRENPNLKWNLFDSVLVASAVAEELLTLMWANGAAPNASPVRLLRILRLVRVIRVIRVMRFFADLRVMVSGIMCSMKSLIWAMLLLFIIMFIFSVCFMQLISDEAAALKEEGRELKDLELFKDAFGSLVSTIFTMFQCITSGMDWGQVAVPLGETHPIMAPLFIVYISFGILCVLNIVTGVFVENAKKITAQDEEHMILEELEAREQWVNECRALFHYTDQDGSGEITWLEFEESVKQPRIQAFMRKIGLDVHSDATHALFSLLDFDEDGVLELDEFVTGAQQLHGSAKSLELARVKFMSRELDRKLTDLTHMCCQHFNIAPPPRKVKTAMTRDVTTSFGAR